VECAPESTSRRWATAIVSATTKRAYARAPTRDVPRQSLATKHERPSEAPSISAIIGRTAMRRGPVTSCLDPLNDIAGWARPMCQSLVSRAYAIRATLARPNGSSACGIHVKASPNQTRRARIRRRA
jgi:hypothetical protein